MFVRVLTLERLVYSACSVCFHFPSTHETVGMLCAASFSSRRRWQTTVMTVTLTCLPSLRSRSLPARAKVSRACLVLMRGLARWIEISFCALSVARTRHVTQLPAHIVGSLSKETRLRSREKRSHAGHFGPFAEAPRREGAKQWYRHRKKSRATELTAATSLARMAGRKAEAGLAV